MKRLAAILAAFGLGLTVVAVANVGAVDEPAVRHVWVEPGDSWAEVAAVCGATAAAVRTANYLSSNAAVRANSWLHCPVVAPTTTTTIAPTTTVAPTTTAAATTTSTTITTTTTTTAAPTTTAATSTTTAPTTTTTTTTTVAPPAGVQFAETFDNNTGLDRFHAGVWHRDPYTVDQTQWPGDHDMNCGTPDTSRTIHRGSPLSGTQRIFPGSSIGGNGVNFPPGEYFYTCVDHLMTSVGDTSGTSILWFSPAMSFPSITEVTFNVNLTNLGMRKWWKVGIVSEAKWNSSDNNQCCGTGPGFLHLDGVLDSADVLWFTWNENQPHGLLQIGWDLGPCCGVQANPAPTDKATRFPVRITDNKNGTLTFSVAGQTLTRPNALPVCPCRVVFTDESYTPNKAEDQQVTNPYTWHWDNVVVR